MNDDEIEVEKEGVCVDCNSSFIYWAYRDTKEFVCRPCQYKRYEIGLKKQKKLEERYTDEEFYEANGYRRDS